MKDYFKDAEFVLDLLYFHYRGNRYQGRGIMTWKPDEGFHLEAFLDDQGEPIENIALGRIGIIPKSDICSIRMRPQGYDWAIAPNILLTDWDELNIQNKRVSISFGRVLFCETIASLMDESLWTGSALYSVSQASRYI